MFGTFSGTQQGEYVTSVSEFRLFFNCTLFNDNYGCSFNGSVPSDVALVGMAWNYETHFWDPTLAPVVSFDATKNNFFFTTEFGYPAVGSGNGNYFQMYAMDPAYPYLNPSVVAQDLSISGAVDNVDVRPSGWKLVAVPEPGTLALLCLGIVGLGVVRRRLAA